MSSIKCIGQFTIDDIVLPDGTVRMGTMGGNALYSAAGANLWQERGTVGAVARVGEDYPPLFLEQLQQRGFDTGALKRIPHSHLRAWLLYESNGERRSLCRNEEVLSYPPISVASFQEYFEAYQKLHLENSPLLSDLEPAARLADAYHLAPQTFRRHRDNLREIRRGNPGAVVSLDPSPFYMSRGSEAEFREILSQVDILLPSREELFSWFGEEVPHREAAASLAAMGPSVVVLKLGKEGSYVYRRETGGGELYPICPIQTVDVTGAGDSYCGGFLAGWLQTGDPACAAACGAVSASFAVAGWGPEKLLQAGPALACKLRDQLLGR